VKVVLSRVDETVGLPRLDQPRAACPLAEI